MSSIFFIPCPERALLVMNDLVDPDLSLRAVASRHNTTVAALSLWIATPETTDDLAILHTAFSDRTRLLATVNSSCAIATLSRILDRVNAADAAPDPELSFLERIRARELAYRAAAALLRLTNFRPAPLGSTRQPAPIADPASAAPVGEAPSSPPPTPTRESAPAPFPSTPFADQDDTRDFEDLPIEDASVPLSSSPPAHHSPTCAHTLDTTSSDTDIDASTAADTGRDTDAATAVELLHVSTPNSDSASDVQSAASSRASTLHSSASNPVPPLALDLLLAALTGGPPLSPSNPRSKTSKLPSKAPSLLAAACHEHWP